MKDFDAVFRGESIEALDDLVTNISNPEVFSDTCIYLSSNLPLLGFDERVSEIVEALLEYAVKSDQCVPISFYRFLQTLFVSNLEYIDHCIEIFVYSLLFHRIRKSQDLLVASQMAFVMSIRLLPASLRRIMDIVSAAIRKVSLSDDTRCLGMLIEGLLVVLIDSELAAVALFNVIIESLLRAEENSRIPQETIEGGSVILFEFFSTKAGDRSFDFDRLFRILVDKIVISQPSWRHMSNLHYTIFFSIGVKPSIAPIFFEIVLSKLKQNRDKATRSHLLSYIFSVSIRHKQLESNILLDVVRALMDLAHSTTEPLGSKFEEFCAAAIVIHRLNTLYQSASRDLLKIFGVESISDLEMLYNDLLSSFQDKLSSPFSNINENSPRIHTKYIAQNYISYEKILCVSSGINTEDSFFVFDDTSLWSIEH